MNENKRALKGTTLVEIIISLAVFALLGVILVQTGTAIDRMNRATNRLNKRVNIQAPYAAAQKTEFNQTVDNGDGTFSVNTIDLDSKSASVTFQLDDSTNADVSSRSAKQVDVKVKKSADSNETVTKSMSARVVLPATAYDTKTIVLNDANVYTPNAANSNHHLKFLVLDDSALMLTPILFDFDAEPTKKTVDITNYYGYTLPDGMTWATTDDTVADVSSNGRVTAKGNGECTISATTTTGFVYTTEVTVEHFENAS